MRSKLRFFLVVAYLLSVAPSAYGAGKVTRVDVAHPPIPGTQVACGDESALGYTPKVKPGRCEFVGRLEFAGHLRGSATRNVAHGAIAHYEIEGLSGGGIKWPSGWAALGRGVGPRETPPAVTK